ncbi:MAG: endolytic transglycosylase MltG, partial [Ruminococcus sp.]|nr:endolytic transglycosylase MltG [Ruminococcus sp.]
MGKNNSFEEQRRRKAANFRLMIQDNYDDEGSENTESEPSELNSYSGQDVKAQIERESRHALKKKMKAEKRELKAKNKRNRRIFRLMWIASVLLVGAMTAVFIINGMNDLLAINRTSSDTVKIQIPKDPTLDQVGDILKENGVIDQPYYFKLFAKITKSEEFSQGTYELSKNMDYQAIITNLEGSSSRTDTVSVTLIEGLNVVEIADKLQSEGALADVDKFLELCNSNKFDEDFDFLND